jgi:hypothetical protein
MGVFGQALGGLAGSLGSALFPIRGINGGELGSAIGSYLPFARGGMVPKYCRGGRVQRKRKTKGRK